MTAVTNSLSNTTGKLRPFDASRDLNDVANLVEACFADTLDAEGRRYIQQMRSAARNPRYLRWAVNFAENVSMPLAGYVWEQNGRIIGNLSIIPFNKQGERIYLIANVAVESSYRRQGIARALTQAALEDIKERGAKSIWLQVREGNPTAFHLYQTLGFKERVRRTTWENEGNNIGTTSSDKIKLPNNITVNQRVSPYWQQLQLWLKQTYPTEVTWHLPLNLKALQPGFLGALYRLFSGMQQQVWVALRGKSPLGVLVWTPGSIHMDHLWLGTSPEYEDEAIGVLIPYVRQQLPAKRKIDLNFPSGRGVQALLAAGLELHQTLIWMELNYYSTNI